MSDQGRWLEPGQAQDWRAVPRGFEEALEAFVCDRADLKYSANSLEHGHGPKQFEGLEE